MELALSSAVILAALLAASTVLSRRIGQVLAEIRTLRGETIGGLAGAEELRRITGLPAPDRTLAEQRHLDMEALQNAPRGVPEDQADGD